MDKVRFGIIGIGNIGSYHANGFSAIKEGELTAVCDINPEAFNRLNETVRAKVQCFDNAGTFLKEAPVDAVLIAVPHYFHPELGIAALRAGKHIIVEKPIAVCTKDGKKLVEEADKHPELVSALMFCQRTTAAHRKIKQLIADGELGTIRRVNWIITDWFRTQHYYDSGDWRASWRGEGGGVLLNQCPHQLDLWQWFFGMPKMVWATAKLGKYHDIEVEDEVNAYMEYENGMVGNFITSTGEMPGTNRLEITADRGRLVFEGGKIEFLRNEEDTATYCKNSSESFRPAAHWKCEVPPCWDTGLNQHQNIIANVCAAILHQSELTAPLSEGLRSLELGNAMLYSGLNHETVNLPLDEEKYAAMLAELVKTSRYPKKNTIVSNDTDMNSSFQK